VNLSNLYGDLASRLPTEEEDEPVRLDKDRLITQSSRWRLTQSWCCAEDISTYSP
jgi:hypothetical protein